MKLKYNADRKRWIYSVGGTILGEFKTLSLALLHINKLGAN
jgi:hypothetical protein